MSVVAPETQLPPGSCDCHFHIYGPFDRFPPVAEGRFTPSIEFPIEDVFEVWRGFGIERGVIVHAAGAGNENGVTLDALRSYPGKLRATALLSPEISDRRLDELTDAGFRSVRAALIRRGGTPPANSGATFEELVKLAPRLAERGWHAQLWIDNSELLFAAPELEKLPLSFVIDHMAHVTAAQGLEHPDFHYFLDRLRSGRYWAKLSGADRNSRFRDPYEEIAPIMRAIIEAAPDRVVWGSDWPHVGHKPGREPNYGGLLRLLMDCTPDDKVRAKVLVENPAKLYGFAEP